jgi:hypothetical protein
MQITGRCCATCKHFHRARPNNECWRYPPCDPVFMGQGPQGPQFHVMHKIVTTPDYVCGEWSQKLEIASTLDGLGTLNLEPLKP